MKEHRHDFRTLAFALLLSAPALYAASIVLLLWLDGHDWIKPGSTFEVICQIYATPARLSYQNGPDWYRDCLDWLQEFCRDH